MQALRPALVLFQRTSLSVLVGIAVSSTVQAQSLIEVYDMAKSYDATYQSAKAQFQANLAKADQAKATILPSVGMTAGTSKSQLELTNNPSSVPGSSRSFGNQTAGVNATQALYRPGVWATYEQGLRALDANEAIIIQAEQDLIVRVSQAYFDVLGAKDSLAFIKAQKTAVAEQLASAKRNFEVGTATITDTREAQARYDLVLAQEIAADNDLRVKSLALENLVGKSSLMPLGIQARVALPVPEGQLETWVAQSEQQHPGIQQSRVNLDIARLETTKTKAGHLPTLDFNLGYNITKNFNGTTAQSSLGIGVTGNQVNVTTASLNFNLPLFAGFATENRIRETVSLEEKARTDLEGVQRQVAQATRTAYLGLQSGLGQVKALEAAETSSQAALDANQLGYKVGVRINIDVLNSQSQLYQTKRDLAKARYDVLVGQLKLRQANGSLKPDDLQAVNALLAK
jgi:outer membrane protein